jgi:hypothetical protein
MKLMASRYDTADLDDIVFLMKKLKIDNEDKAIDVVTKYFNEKDILPKTMYYIKDAMQIIKESCY